MSPDSYNAEVLKTLKSIDERVSRMEGMLMALCAGRGVSGGNGTTGGAKASPGGSQRGGGGLVADARDLDSQYGDPTVKKDPKRWTGESFAGCRISECPPEYLEVLADLINNTPEIRDYFRTSPFGQVEIKVPPHEHRRRRHSPQTPPPRP